MGGELLEEAPHKTLTEIFWEAYPAYLTLGMPPEEYWHGDAQSCVAYRKAHEERQKMQDVYAWRQGLYIYHALCCVAPYFNSIKPRKPDEYIKPFSMKEEIKPQETETNDTPAIAFVKAWANKVNAKRNSNGGN